MGRLVGVWALGAVAIGILACGEALELRGRPGAGRILAVLGVVAGAAAHLVAMLGGGHLGVPPVIRVAGGLVTAGSLVLLAQSLVFELPRGGGYLGPRGVLVTTGTYALVRHPGVLWHLGLLAGLSALSGSLTLVGAIPVWVGANILYTWIQDRHFLPRVYGEAYERYRRAVPMLIPTRRSIAACMSGVRPFRTGGGGTPTA